MNKTELVDAIAKKTKQSKVATAATIKAFMEVATATLKKGESIQLIGFGTFEVRKRAARNGKNPATGQPIQIPASKVAAFKAGQSLKDAVNSKKK